MNKVRGNLSIKLLFVFAPNASAAYSGLVLIKILLYVYLNLVYLKQ